MLRKGGKTKDAVAEDASSAARGMRGRYADPGGGEGGEGKGRPEGGRGKAKRNGKSEEGGRIGIK